MWASALLWSVADWRAFPFLLKLPAAMIRRDNLRLIRNSASETEAVDRAGVVRGGFNARTGSRRAGKTQ